MSLPDPKTLDIVADGVPFVRVDLSGNTTALDVVADGIPWVGYRAPAAPAGLGWLAALGQRQYTGSPLSGVIQ